MEEIILHLKQTIKEMGLKMNTYRSDIKRLERNIDVLLDSLDKKDNTISIIRQSLEEHLLTIQKLRDKIKIANDIPICEIFKPESLNKTAYKN